MAIFRDSNSSINSSSPIPLKDQNETKYLVNCYEYLHLFKFTYKQFFMWTIFPPLLSLISAFIIGCVIDSEKLFYYEWTCGVQKKINNK